MECVRAYRPRPLSFRRARSRSRISYMIMSLIGKFKLAVCCLRSSAPLAPCLLPPFECSSVSLFAAPVRIRVLLCLPVCCPRSSLGAPLPPCLPPRSSVGVRVCSCHCLCFCVCRLVPYLIVSPQTLPADRGIL